MPKTNPKRKQVFVSLLPEMVEELVAAGQAQCRTLSQEIEYRLRRSFEAEQAGIKVPLRLASDKR
jgi:hypothetical protein